jgi:hypothetical protein
LFKTERFNFDEQEVLWSKKEICFKYKFSVSPLLKDFSLPQIALIEPLYAADSPCWSVEALKNKDC